MEDARPRLNDCEVRQGSGVDHRARSDQNGADGLPSITRAPTRRDRPPLGSEHRKAGNVAVGYALAAAVWIVGTDSIGYWVTGGGDASLTIYLSGIGKGLLFVAVTAAILYALILKLCRTERIREHATLDTTAQILDASPTVLFRWANAPGWPLEFVSENVRQFGYEASARCCQSKIDYFTQGLDQ